MAKSIMIQGTMSNAGKSLIVAALCRIFQQDGHTVAPFKSQNMALNSFVTKDGLEMGRAQVVQAEAAKIEPSVDMNPILLKPTTDMGSQVIVHGQVYGNMTAMQYHNFKPKLVDDIMSSYNKLAQNYDIIVIEGAGSPAEINLKQNDIVNMGMAKMAKAPVLLAADIDRGGVFAQLYGTIALLESDEQSMIKGMIINKFRGDEKILLPGLDMLKAKMSSFCDIPFAGIIPYINVDIDDEDSLSDRLHINTQQKLIDIAIIKFPKISNFTDINPFQRYENVSVRYINSSKELKNPDMILLPGTKSTISDLVWLRESGLEVLIKKAAEKNTIIFGICGGYQMLGQTVSDPHNIEGGNNINGLGLLNISTVFEKEKIRTQTTGLITDIEGVLSSLNGLTYTGYEIHMGRSNTDKAIFSHKNVYGTYIHGFFDETDIAAKIIETLCNIKGIAQEQIEKFDINEYKNMQYDTLASAVRKSLNMKLMYDILKNGI